MLDRLYSMNNYQCQDRNLVLLGLFKQVVFVVEQTSRVCSSHLALLSMFLTTTTTEISPLPRV